MPIFDPELLSKWARGDWKERPGEAITGFSIDSRTISKGDMFVAVSAERDGHDFLRSAQESGAVAGLVERLDLTVPLPQLVVDDTLASFQGIASEHRGNFTGKVVGVTGSCGKTSTKDALGLLMGADTLCTEGNLNNHLGVPLTLLRMNNDSHRYAIVEAGINQVGEMSTLARTISPDLVIVTVVGHSHLKGLGSIENVAREKALLFEDSPSAPLVLFPEDCLTYENFLKRRESGVNHIVLREGKPSRPPLATEAFYSIWTETNKNGGSLSLGLWRYGSPFLSFSLPAVTAGMARNAALAVMAACELGVSVQEISERLPQYRPSALRGRRFQGRGRTYLLDCYNANPASMKDSLSFFRDQWPHEAKLYVLGGMEELGEDGPALHRAVGAEIEVMEKDAFILMGEKASWMAEGILEAGARDEQVIVLSEIDDARPIIEDFDGSVLFKGSRLNRLEELLPAWAVDAEAAEDAVEC